MQVSSIELLIFYLVLHNPTSEPSDVHHHYSVRGIKGNWHLWTQQSLMLLRDLRCSFSNFCSLSWDNIYIKFVRTVAVCSCSCTVMG